MGLEENADKIDRPAKEWSDAEKDGEKEKFIKSIKKRKANSVWDVC